MIAFPRNVSSTKPSTIPRKRGLRLNRRQFLKASLASAGFAVSGGMLANRALAAKPGSGLPSQLPYTSSLLNSITGLDIPFFLPVEIDPFFAGAAGPFGDPLTMANFNGVVGVVEAEGVSANNSEGVRRTWGTDIRFMKGVFTDRDGRTQRGAFGFF